MIAVYSSAKSTARSKADILCIVSSNSKSGLLSKTTPPPAWAYAIPSYTTSVRIAMAVSMFPAKSKYPTPPE